MKPALLFALTLVVVVFIAVHGCSDGPRTERVLRAAGYTDIHTGGYEFSCSDSDSLCTGFRASGPAGNPVKGAVGCGYVFKGCTIRIDE